MEEISPSLFLVLGPHRSGSSISTRTLEILGLNLGNNLLGGDPSSNEMGHFEELSVLQFNEKILLDSNTNWMDPTPLKNNDFFEKNRTIIKSELEVLLNVLIEVDRIEAIKEPRISLMLELWEPALFKYFEKLGIVLTIRHPSEVAESLKRRNGLNYILGHIIWVQSTINSLRFARSHRNHFLFYDNLIKDTEDTVRELSGFLGKRSVFESQKDSLRDNVLSDFRHHEVQSDVISKLFLSSEIYHYLLSHKNASEDSFPNELLDLWQARLLSIQNEVNWKKLIQADESSEKTKTQERDQLTQERELVYSSTIWRSTKFLRILISKLLRRN